MNSVLPPLSPAGWIYALAYLIGMAAFALMARRRSLWTEGVGSVAVAGLLGGLLGANLAQWLGAGGPGKTILGGIAGGYLCVFLWKRHLGIRRPLGDLFAVAISAGEMVGRWGCFVGGCCYGRACDLPWAVVQHGAPRHPAQIYLSLASGMILLILLWVEKRRLLPENGLFFLQGLLYSGARFIIEFFRENTPLAGGLTTAQFACIFGMLFFGVLLTRLISFATRAERALP